MKILINHLGYEYGEPKRALLACEKAGPVGGFWVADANTGKTVLEGVPEECGEVAKWGTGYYYLLNFDKLRREGSYRVRCRVGGAEASSYPFDIRKNLLGPLLSDAAFCFKAERISGEWMWEDRALPFREGLREGVRDVHGGWHDASGDTGAHMSHLSFSSFFNPQQHPFSVYAFFQCHDLMERSGNPLYRVLCRRYLDEAYWGADFIMRMRAESGSFYRAIRRMDSFGTVHGSRKIDFEYSDRAKRDNGEITDQSYETSLRCGGGLCVAALAMAGAHFYPSAEYSQREYLLAAKESYDHLVAHNEQYTNDGKWNLLDEYCALVAATELYKATREYAYREKARALAEKMEARMCDAGGGAAYFTADGTGRPFFHAADAGMPVVALLNYAAEENDDAVRTRIVGACKKAMAFELRVTGSSINPFGYARQLVRTGGADKETFFFPHDTEAAPWWQGENARLASLATAAELMAEWAAPGEFRDALLTYAANQLNWILGLNPFDSCMMTGKGRNNPRYYSNYNHCFFSSPGGICNGITSGWQNDDEILYVADEDPAVADNWRWAELWIPHLSWFMYAVAQKKISPNRPEKGAEPLC